jgi:uncharacterized protein (TIGR03437 family)
MRDLLRVLFAAALCAPFALAQDSWGRTEQVETEHPVLKTVILDGKPLTFRVMKDVAGDYALVDGDVNIGRVADIEAAAQAEATGAKTIARQALVGLNALGAVPLWPNNTIHYVIDPSYPNPALIQAAIDHWMTKTQLKLVPRVAEADYVRFQPASGTCNSLLGRAGGVQAINLDPTGCPVGSIIHEIGHAFGLLHEQSRADRNTFLTMVYENIDSTYYSQFAQARASRDLGYYDYGSIMHYGTIAFSLEDKIVEESVPPGIPLGQRVGLSPADIDQISRTYGIVPTRTAITTIPEGLPIYVDGERYVSPAYFNWAPGGFHTVFAEDRVGTLPAGFTGRYDFVRWTDGGAAGHGFVTDPSVTVIAATFKRSVQLTTLVLEGEGTIEVSPQSADGYYVVGTELSFVAKPAAGQSLRTWASLPSLPSLRLGPGSPTFKVEIGGSFVVGAVFSDKPLTTITTTPPNQLVVIDGVSTRVPVKMDWAPGTVHTLNLRTPYSSATASTRYRFAGWMDGTTNALRTITTPAASTTYNVRLLETHFMDFTRAGTGGLTITPADSPYIDAGMSLDIIATPSTGQAVQYWLGDVTGTGNTKTVLMDRPRRVVAVMGPALPFRMVNAASFLVNPYFEQPVATVAPLEMVTLFGANVGPATLTPAQLDAQGRIATGSGNTRVLFDGVPSPIYNTSSTQTTVIVPKEVAGRSTTTVSLERNGVVTGTVTLAVAPTLPGVFTSNATGTGPIFAINQDGTRNSASNPAAAGSYITFWATGAGLMDGNAANGQIMSNLLVGTQAQVFVRLGKEPMPVYYAGSTPGVVNGVIQVNAQIPAGTAAGEWPIRVVMGQGMTAPGLTVFTR